MLIATGGRVASDRQLEDLELSRLLRESELRGCDLPNCCVASD